LPKYRGNLRLNVATQKRASSDVFTLDRGVDSHNRLFVTLEG
jgi:hypothetical protein